MEAPRTPRQPAAIPAVDSAGGDPDFNPLPSIRPDESVGEGEGTVVENCPKCKGKLVDPRGLGWCKACGYCKSLEDDKDLVPPELPPAGATPSTLGMIEFGVIIGTLPGWAKVLLGVAISLLALNVAATFCARDALARAIWSTVELILGVLMIFTAQIWALCLLAPYDDKLSFKDAVIPGRLWTMAWRKAPLLVESVWLASWGVTCILSALLVVGGMAHWLDYLPKKPTQPPAVEQPQ